MVVVLILLWTIIFLVDYSRCSNFKEPIYVVAGETADDGGTGTYYGLGYKVEIEKTISPEYGTKIVKIEMYILDKFIIGAIENVNIHGIFREGFRLGEYLEVSQEELELLQQKGAAIEWDTIKLPIEDMNAVLKKYVNLSLEETNKVDLDNLYYLDDYKAYYICVSDCAYTQYDFFNGWTNEDGTITLQYSQWYSQRDKEIYRVTLREEDGRYYFVSNMKE
jgi:hypothetical protein